MINKLKQWYRRKTLPPTIHNLINKLEGGDFTLALGIVTVGMIQYRSYTVSSGYRYHSAYRLYNGDRLSDNPWITCGKFSGVIYEHLEKAKVKREKQSVMTDLGKPEREFLKQLGETK